MVNRRRAKSIMEQAGVDCLVGTSLQNVLYLTGFNSFLKQVTPSTLVFGIFFDSKSSEAKLVTSYSEGDIVAASETKAEDVELYGTFPLELSKKHVGYREKRLYELCSRPTALRGPLLSLPCWRNLVWIPPLLLWMKLVYLLEYSTGSKRFCPKQKSSLARES